jgi:hypothetical protein
MSPLSKCFDARLLPSKKPLLISQDCQVDIPEEVTPKNERADMATMTEKVQDSPVVAYQLQQSNSKYQESMIQSILKDKRITDKNLFIQKLVSKVGSVDLKVQIDDLKKKRKAVSGLSEQQQSYSNLSTVD